MGHSNNLFIAHREEMLAQMNRKELAQEAEFYATKLLEEKEPEEILSQTLRIESFVSAINKELKTKITENTSFGGVEFLRGRARVRRASALVAVPRGALRCRPWPRAESLGECWRPT